MFLSLLKLETNLRVTSQADGTRQTESELEVGANLGTEQGEDEWMKMEATIDQIAKEEVNDWIKFRLISIINHLKSALDPPSPPQDLYATVMPP